MWTGGAIIGASTTTRTTSPTNSTNDKSGRWDAAHLHVQASRDRDKAQKILARTVPLTHKSYTVANMTALTKVMGLTVENAPGKSYPRKEQLLQALYPVWVSCAPKRRAPESSSKLPPPLAKREVRVAAAKARASTNATHGAHRLPHASLHPSTRSIHKVIVFVPESND